MEFLIKTDLSTMPEKIDFNFEEMKSELTEKLETYNALVVTEDSIKEAKSDRANLNKLKTAIEDKRKEIKKLCLAPYESFEKKCKEIVALIDQPIKSIDGQIAVFDQKLQDEKWEQISAYYKAEVKELASVVPLEKIVSPKWKNKTESVETVCNGIGDTLDRIRTELEMLGNCPAEFLDQIRDVYLKNFNLTEARTEYKRLEERKKQIEAMEAAKIEASKQKPEEVPTPAVAPDPVPAEAPAPEKIPYEKPKVIDAPVYGVSFRVKGTEAQIRALRQFMMDNEISYEVIK
ncbi:MAG: DUF1351 domain-containing protein [Oscillospiraceae bacterium]|nr:DUF1351 domain-containing protein [Oscillospiraceae bacterium]